MLEIHYSACGAQRLLTDIARHVGVKHPKDPRVIKATPDWKAPDLLVCFGHRVASQ